MKRSPMTRSKPLRATPDTARLTVMVPRARKCRAKGCEVRFVPARPLQVACCAACAYSIGMAVRLKQDMERSKAEKAADKVRREKLKPRAKWLAEAQAAVNRYVRARDRFLGCCSCDRGPEWDGQWHASHLRSVGAASSVRFNLWNIAKSCSICNHHLSGNLVGYLPRARERLGDARVDWLYTQNALANYDVDYLRRLKAVFTKKANRQEKRNAAR